MHLINLDWLERERERDMENKITEGPISCIP